MVHGKNRIPYRIDRRLTAFTGPDYGATISFGLPFETEDSQYGKSWLKQLGVCLSSIRQTRPHGANLNEEMATILTALWTIAALAAGALVGLKFPDIDQRLDFLLHRSAITHGPLIPLLLFLALRNVRQSWARLFPMYLCLGFVVHMGFDLFPAGWSGYALISIPTHGWIPGWASILWLTGSLLLCAYWAARLTQGLSEAALLAGGTVGIFIAAAPGEMAVVGPLLVVMTAVAIGAAVNLFRNTE